MHPFSKPLLAWYDRSRRDLPWRKTRDPYRILVSEIMLQQTQVSTVIPYYHRFLKAFPSFKSLSRATIGRVLKLWEGLGYYSRARNLHDLAKIVTHQYGGDLPSDRTALLALPGIGSYTAGALQSIAFNQDCAVVDGNVERVLTRYIGFTQDPRSPKGKAKIWELAESLVPAGRAGDYNQAVMDLGATLCTPTNPACSVCPVAKPCRARRRNQVEQIPRKKISKVIPHYHIGAGVVWKGKTILIDQRPYKGLLGGLWEFPGGKQNKGESLPECVRREINEELGIKVTVGKKLAQIPHAYSHFKITLHVYACRYRSGKPQALGCRAWKWIKPIEFKKFAFPAANQPVIQQILADHKK